MSIFNEAVSPDDWGAKNNYDSWSQGSFKQDKWVLHWHGPAVNESDPYKVMRSIEDFHINGRGWRGFAYGYAIAPDGTLFRGRGEKPQASHTGDVDNDGINENKEGLSVLFMFGEGQQVTKKAFETFKRMWKERQFPVFGHRDIKNTSCPGDQIYEWLKAYKFKVAPDLELKQGSLEVDKRLLTPDHEFCCPSCGKRLKVV